MKIKSAFLRTIKTFLVVVGSTIALDSCNSNLNEASLSPRNSRAGAKLSNCSIYSSGNMVTMQRDRLVSQYGSDGGSAFDQGRTLDPNNAYFYVYNYSQNLSNYILQLQSAARNACQNYVTSQQPTNGTYNYFSDVLRISVLNALFFVQNQASNDSSLNQQERQVIEKVIEAVSNNFLPASDLIESQLDSGYNANCFPNPDWYPSGSSGAATNGFFNAALNIIKKTVNIVATLVVNIIEQAAYMSIYGIVGGFVVAGGPLGVLPGLAVGAIIGGALGIVVAVNDMLEGRYECIFAPCS